MRVIVIMCLAVFVFAGCKQEKQVQETMDLDDTIVTDNPAPVTEQAQNKFEELIKKFEALKQDTALKLQKEGKGNSNTLYDNYAVRSRQIIDSLNNADYETLDQYHSFFHDQKGNKISPPDSIQKKTLQLKKAGLEYRPDGEGMGYITTMPEHYYNLFKDYVSADYKNFLKISAEHEKVAFAYDAGLNISIEEVGQRVLDWERYLNKYPNSKLSKSAREQYEIYQYAFLFGLDNTPAFEYSDGKLNPENKKGLQNFIAANPDSFTSRLAKVVVESNGEPVDKVSAKVEQIQKQEAAKN